MTSVEMESTSPPASIPAYSPFTSEKPATGESIQWVNCHQVIPSEMPHGGFKQSGVGKDLSIFGLEDYTRIKHVMSSHAS